MLSLGGELEHLMPAQELQQIELARAVGRLAEGLPLQIATVGRALAEQALEVDRGAPGGFGLGGNFRRLPGVCFCNWQLTLSLSGTSMGRRHDEHILVNRQNLRCGPRRTDY